MSDIEITAALREIRTAIRLLREDVRRLEMDLIEVKLKRAKRKWWHL